MDDKELLKNLRWLMEVRRDVLLPMRDRSGGEEYDDAYDEWTEELVCTLAAWFDRPSAESLTCGSCPYSHCGECGKCGKDEGDVESTYCGSMCLNCRAKHAEECEVCDKDFRERGIV